MKKQLIATVINPLKDTTVKVEVIRHWTHPIYKKTVTKRKNYLVHSQLAVKPGEKVLIEETPPISKRKRYKLIKKI